LISQGILKKTIKVSKVPIAYLKGVLMVSAVLLLVKRALLFVCQGRTHRKYFRRLGVYDKEG